MAMAVWPTKIAHCFAGAFPFEHAGGEGPSPVTPCIGFVVFCFTRDYYCPLCSISTLTYLLVFVLHSTWNVCAVAVLG
jgi:hypothetical protein